MERQPDIDRWTVAELLATSPEIIRYFIKRGLHCTVCPMSRFESLSDVAKHHRVKLNELRKEILELIRPLGGAPQSRNSRRR